MIKTYTMTDVRAAKIKATEARKTRSGLATVDYILSQVHEGDEPELAAAIAYLKNIKHDRL